MLPTAVYRSVGIIAKGEIHLDIASAQFYSDTEMENGRKQQAIC